MIVEASSRDADRYLAPSFEAQRLELIGMSMFPALWPGDQFEVALAGSMSSGDVVVFVGGDGRRLAHRVQGHCSRSGLYLTIGDTNAKEDAPVPETAVIGRVVTVRRCVLGRWLIVPRVFWRRRVLPTGVAWTLRWVASGLVRFSRRVGVT